MGTLGHSSAAVEHSGETGARWAWRADHGEMPGTPRTSYRPGSYHCQVGDDHDRHESPDQVYGPDVDEPQLPIEWRPRGRDHRDRPYDD